MCCSSGWWRNSVVPEASILSGGCGALGHASREAGFVATGRISVDQALGGHLVDHRDGLPKGGRDGLGIAAVDSRPDIAESAT